MIVSSASESLVSFTTDRVSGGVSEVCYCEKVKLHCNIEPIFFCELSVDACLSIQAGCRSIAALFCPKVVMTCCR